MIHSNTKQIDVTAMLQTPSIYYQIVPRYETRVGRPLFEGKNEHEVVAKLQYAFSIGAKPK